MAGVAWLRTRTVWFESHRAYQNFLDLLLHPSRIRVFFEILDRVAERQTLPGLSVWVPSRAWRFESSLDHHLLLLL